MNNFHHAHVGILTVFLAGVLGASAVHADFIPEEWLYTKDITLPVGITPDTLIGVELDSEVFAHSKSDLGDLRIVDADGTEVPYVLRSETAKREVVTYMPSILDLSYVPGSHTSFLVDFGGNVPHNKITVLTSSENFRRQVTVSGSNDRASWYVLTEGKDIYDYSMEFAARDTNISYPESLYRYLLVRIEDDGEEPLSVSGVTAQQLAVMRAKKVTYESAVTGTQKDTQTILTLDLGQRGLETDTLLLNISSQNYERYVTISASDDREEWVTVGSDVLYSYQTSKINSAKTSVQYQPIKKRYIRLTINNYDNQPLVIGETATLQGLAHSILFLANPGKVYGLYYGYTKGYRPRYDFESVYRQFDDDEIVRVELGSEKASPFYKTPEPPPEPVVPWTEQYASALISAVYAFAGGLLVFLMMTIFRRTKEQVQTTTEVGAKNQDSLS